MKNILVTGGLGFIGSHTVVELCDQGYNPVIVDNLSNSKIEVHDRIDRIASKSVSFEEGDLRDKAFTERVFDKFKFEGVIHFAASKAVGESVEKPLLYYENNLTSLVNILEQAKRHETSNFIFSSSCTVYGQPDRLPVDESFPKLPAESPYGNTKQIGEEIIQDFCKANSAFKAISLRYFNPVGAHESAMIGELPLGVPANLVPFITQTAAGIRSQLSIFGGDYNTPDGTCIRDYIHVVDLAKAHVLALEYSSRMNLNYDFFNVGTGKGCSVLDVIKAFESASGEKLNYKIVDRRPGDIEKIYADTNKVNQLLGWKAEKGLNEMMKSAWEWQKKLAID
ncbi:MAG: UDP-glucose 4-epimerase GalE [Ekhidna sp.]|nr:UDP-glucose 4-epimerase GalE [Ekhidna sp.]